MRVRLVLTLGIVLLATAAAPPVTASAGSGGQASNAACSFPVALTDATGTNVTLASAPARVVTLSPSAAQTMWDIDASGEVVGVTRYAGYLDGASSRTNVSGSGSAYFDEEAIVGAKPDLVLAPDTVPKKTVTKLRNDGLTVYHYRPATSMTDVENQTLVTGRLTGHCSDAHQTVARMKSRLRRVRSAVNGTKHPRVLYTFFGTAAGNGTFVDRIIAQAGGDNVAADAGISGYKQISEEVIVARNPQWIVRNDQQPAVPKNGAYNSTVAVKAGHVVVLNNSYVSEPAPRIVRPITKLAKALHPQAFAAANATTNVTANATSNETVSPSGSNTADTTGASGTSATSAVSPTSSTSASSTPGFGAVVALAGVLAAFVGRALWD